jgi:glycine cleavage system aminomethyltransferase T
MREPIMRTPAARMHAELGATFAREAGWELPAVYGDPEAERRALRESVAIADVTPRGKIDVRGRIDAALPVGGDGELVARISDTWALLLASPGPMGERAAKLETGAGGAAMVTDVTHLYAGYVLAGPRLPEVLSRLTSFDPDSLSAGEATGAPIAEVRGVWRRAELGFPLVEVFVAAEFGRYAWRAMSRVVRDLGGIPAGWEALRAEGWS